MRLLESNLTPDPKSIARFQKIDSLRFHNGFIAVDGVCVTAEVFHNILHVGKYHALIIARSRVK
jgi:hypothetical protein